MAYFKEVYNGVCNGVYKLHPVNKKRLIGNDKSCNSTCMSVAYCGSMIPISKSTYYRYTKLLSAWRLGNHYIKLLK